MVRAKKKKMKVKKEELPYDPFERFTCILCGKAGCISHMWKEVNGQVCLECFKSVEGRICKKAITLRDDDTVLDYTCRLMTLVE